MSLRGLWCSLVILAGTAAGARDAAPSNPVLVLDSGGHTALIRKVLFTRDGRELITASWDKTIRTWDVASGEPLRTLRPPIGDGDQGRVLDIALSPDGRLLASGGWGVGQGMGWVYILSMTTGRIERVLKGHTNIINALSFAAGPDGRTLLASASWDGTARIWDVATGRCEQVLKEHTRPVKGVAFAPDGRRLVTASYDGTARIWSVADGGFERMLDENSGRLLCAAWSPDGATVATGGFDRSIRLWRSDGTLLRSIERLENNVGSIVFTRDSREILYTWGDLDAPGEGAAILDIASGRERVRFAKHDSTVFSGALSPDGTLAATAGGSAREVYLWRTADATPVQRLVGKGRPAWSAGWSPDGRAIAWGQTRKFTAPNDRGPLEQTFRPADLERGGPPDANYRRAVESRGSLHLVASGHGVGIKVGDEEVTRLDSGYSGDWVASYTLLGSDSTAIGTTLGHYLLFDTRSGTLTRFFRSHTDSVWAMAPSPDGRHLLTASSDQTLRIADPRRDAPLLSFFSASDDWIAWTPEGYYAASPGGENLMGWQISNGPEQVGTFVPAGRFHKSLYRPDVIKLLLSTGSLARALEVLDEQMAARTIQQVLPPVVIIASPERSGIQLDSPELEVRVVARGQVGQPVTSIGLIVDGRPYGGEQPWRSIDANRAARGDIRESWRISLEPGRHRLAAVATSAVSDGRSEEMEVIYREQVANRPRLCVLAVGVSTYPGGLRLGYAAADARELEAMLRAKSAPLFEAVQSRVVLDRDATRRAFLGGLTWLRETMRDGDVGLVFFSGHGAYRDETFYMLPVDADVTDLVSTAVAAEQFKKILTTTRGRLVVLLDACHSGAETAGLGPRVPARLLGSARPGLPVRRPRPDDSRRPLARLLGAQPDGDLLAKQLQATTDDLVRDLSRDERGIITMSSSTGREVSLESRALRHGYFTKALLEGLSGLADSNKDGYVYVNELDLYLSDRVKALSKDRQHPATSKPSSVLPFALTRP